MPWTDADAERHTHLADTPAKQKKWAAIANADLAEHGDDAQAIRTANGVLKRDSHQHEFHAPHLRRRK
jgi:hypothetical protein